MSTTLESPLTPLSELSRGTLPRWALPALAVVVLAVSAGVFAVTPLQGVVEYLLFAAVVYVLAQTVVSAAVEGKARSRDRLATAITTAALILAILPLIGVLGYTISRGLKRFDPTFFTHSMRNIGARDATGGRTTRSSAPSSRWVSPPSWRCPSGCWCRFIWSSTAAAGSGGWSAPSSM